MKLDCIKHSELSDLEMNQVLGGAKYICYSSKYPNGIVVDFETTSAMMKWMETNGGSCNRLRETEIG